MPKKLFIKLKQNYQLNVNLLKEYKMKKKETKKMTKTQAIKDIDKLKKDLFNFRFQKINGQLKSPAKVLETKKTIARLKTLIEKESSA